MTSCTVVRHLDDASFDAVMRIYEDSIKAPARKTEATLKYAFSDPDYILVLSRDGGILTGFAGLILLDREERLWLFDYMAVAPNARSRGIGSALFGTAMKAIEQRSPRPVCLLEVDVPVPGQPTYRDDIARMRFYARLDCVRIDGLQYLFPLRVPGASPPPPMCLLVHGMDRTNSVAKERLRLWLARVYTKVYYMRNDDPRIQAMVQPLTEPVDLVPIDAS